MKPIFQKLFIWCWISFSILGSVRTLHAIEITHVEATNVTTSSFTIFWQATEGGTPSLTVFADPDGFAEVTDSVRIEYFPLATGDVTLPHEYADRVERRDLQATLRGNGLFLARVSGCAPGTTYYFQARTTNENNEVAESAVGSFPAVQTAAQTAFVRESLQVMIEFPAGNANGLVATLSTPAAAHPLVWPVGDGGFADRAFFNLSDFVAADTNTNLETNGPLPLTIRLHRPEGTAEMDDGQEVSFTETFVVAEVADLIFSGSGEPQLVHGFAFSPIGTQTAGVPFRVTIRALDEAGEPLTDFTGVAELAASGNLLRGSGPTPAFIDGVLRDHLLAIEEPGERTLSVSLPEGVAESVSDPFRVTGSYERWLISQFPDPEDRNDPLVSSHEADPWGTGVSNLVAYATGTDPRNPDRTRLPQPVLHQVEGSDSSHLAITYARDKGSADVMFLPEVSGDLTAWNSGPDHTEEVEVVDRGHYELVTARDLTPFDEEQRRFMRLRVRSGESLSSWQAHHFPGEKFLDPAWSSSEADPAGDGVTNLMKYALGLDPNIPARDGLPTISTADISDERFLILSYTRPKDRTDIEYIVEVSSDLVNWNSGIEYTETLFRVDRDSEELIIVRDLRPLEDGSQRFARLRVRRR